MRTVTLTCDVPVVREDGKALPKTEIDNTEVLFATVATDGTVSAFTSLSKVKPDATQTVNQDMPDATYKFRFIVTDIFGKKGKPVDATAVIASAPPGVVTNIKVTVA